MKSLIQAVVVAAALAAPVVVFAQANAPVTRAQVRAELVQLENAGYHPGDGDQTTYPAQIQAAEAKVAAQNAQNAQTATAQARVADTSGVGGVISGSSASDAPAVVRPVANDGMKPIYFGH
jgi:nucleoid-associated protein YgaU